MAMAERMRRNIADHKLMLRHGESVQVMTDIVCVSSPSDGATLRELLGSARLRLSGTRPRLPTHIH
jgi:hypothetical protein